MRKELNTNTTGEENPCNFLHAKFKETIKQAIFSHRMETQPTAMPCLLTTIQKMGCDGLLMPWVVFTTFQHQRETMTTELSRAAFWLLQIQQRKQPASLLSSKRMANASLLWRIHSTTWMPSTDIPNKIFAFSSYVSKQETAVLTVWGAGFTILRKPDAVSLMESMWLPAFVNLKGTEGERPSITSVP